jgi:hypothetical protein
MLDDLLWGKYRNPLFGLLGAHFLIRKLRRDAQPDPADLTRLTLVTGNLGDLLGTDAPDIVALRLWRALIAKERPAERLPDEPPLFNVGFQAFIEATAWLDWRRPDRRFDEIALGLDGNSPWTLWKPDTTSTRSWASHDLPRRTSTFGVKSASIGKLRAIEKVWREAGFAVETGRDGELRSLRATREGDDSFDAEGWFPPRRGFFDAAYTATYTILRVPDSVVGYMRDALDQSGRTGNPLDFARLVRRTMLPLSVLLAAKTLAEEGHAEREWEASADTGRCVEKDEDDGEMSAGAT